VFGHVDTNGIPLSDWHELRRPPYYTNSLDLAFEIITTPATNKWLQVPDTSYNGMDVKATAPKMLADDFRCNFPARSSRCACGLPGSSTWCRPIRLASAWAYGATPRRKEPTPATRANCFARITFTRANTPTSSIRIR